MCMHGPVDNAFNGFRYCERLLGVLRNPTKIAINSTNALQHILV